MHKALPLHLHPPTRTGNSTPETENRPLAPACQEVCVSSDHRQGQPAKRPKPAPKTRLAAFSKGQRKKQCGLLVEGVTLGVTTTPPCPALMSSLRIDSCLCMGMGAGLGKPRPVGVLSALKPPAGSLPLVFQVASLHGPSHGPTAGPQPKPRPPTSTTPLPTCPFPFSSLASAVCILAGPCMRLGWGGTLPAGRLGPFTPLGKFQWFGPTASKGLVRLGTWGGSGPRARAAGVCRRDWVVIGSIGSCS